jgi:predicted  nucleic acid-binding Zn-ribbon protein
MTVVESLYRLQQLDTKLLSLQEEEKNLPQRVEVEEARSELASLEEKSRGLGRELEELRERQRRKEQLAEELGRKIAAEEDKLYGGKVSNPKELRSIQAEVQSLKRKRDQEETSLLECMERAEELEGALAELEKEESSLRTRLREAEEALRGELERIEESREELMGQVGELRSGIPEGDLKLYDELLGSRHGLAVVKAVDGACQGCHMALPAQEYDRFLKSEGIFRCSNCRRILVK